MASTDLIEALAQSWETTVLGLQDGEEGAEVWGSDLSIHLEVSGGERQEWSAAALDYLGGVVDDYQACATGTTVIEALSKLLGQVEVHNRALLQDLEKQRSRR